MRLKQYYFFSGIFLGVVMSVSLIVLLNEISDAEAFSEKEEVSLFSPAEYTQSKYALPEELKKLLPDNSCVARECVMKVPVRQPVSYLQNEESLQSQLKKLMVFQNSCIARECLLGSRPLFISSENTLIDTEKEELSPAEVKVLNDFLQFQNDQARKYGSKSFRNNNPGNLRYKGQIGTIGADSEGFAVFPDYESGKQAHMRQIQVDADRGLTLIQFVKKYAPRSGDSNNPYANAILKFFPGADYNTSLTNFDKERLQKYMQMIEGWFPPENPSVASEDKTEKSSEITPSQEIFEQIQKNLQNGKTEQFTNEVQEKMYKNGCADIVDTIERLRCMRTK